MPSVVNVYWFIALPGPAPSFGLEARFLCPVSALTTCHCSLLLFPTLRVRTGLGDEEKWVLEVRQTKESPTSSCCSPCCSGIGNSLMSQEGGEKTDSLASCYNTSTCFIPRWGENFELVVFRKLATEIYEKICAIFRRTYCRNVCEYTFFTCFCYFLLFWDFLLGRKVCFLCCF